MARVKSYAVIGMGGFGTSVARNLAQEGMEVMIIDVHKDKINAISSEVTHALQLDATNEIAMKNIGLENMDGVIIAIGERLEVSVMATIICKEIGVPLVIVKTETGLQKKILEKVGADQVILPETESGYRLAKNITGNFIDFFNLSNQMSIAEMSVRPEWLGKSLKELNLRSRYHINILSVQQAGEDIPDGFPDPDEPFREGDIVIIAGKNEDIQKINDH